MSKNAGENPGDRDARGRFRPGNRAGRRSSGGKPGRSGRPPVDFQAWAEAMRDGPARVVVERVLREGRDAAALRAAGLVLGAAGRYDHVVSLGDAVGALRAVLELVGRYAGSEVADRVAAEIEAQLRDAAAASEPYPRQLSGTLLRLRPSPGDGGAGQATR